MIIRSAGAPSRLLLPLLLAIAFWPSSSLAQTKIDPNQINWTGYPLYAANFAGADWCAKTANAIAALPGTGGTVQINVNAGTSACASTLTVPSNTALQFTQAGTWTTSCNGISVSSATNVQLSGVPGVVLTMPNSCANFSHPMQILSSTGVSVHGFEVNGNGNNVASGQQSHCIYANDSNRVKIYENYIHDCQGDGVTVNTDGSMTSGAEDWEIRNNSFANIGRDFITLVGYGANDWRATDNYFLWGTNVSTSTVTGNAIHIEGDNAGTGFNRLTVSRNVINGTGTSSVGGSCISTSSQPGNPILGLIITDNQCIGINSNVPNSAGILLFAGQDAIVKGNLLTFSGATAGELGIQINEQLSTAAALFRTIVSNNVVEGTTSGCISLTNAGSSGNATTFEVAGNICNNTGSGSGFALGAIQLLAGTSSTQVTEADVHDNTITSVNGGGMDIIGVNRFHVHHNIIRNFGLSGGAQFGINIGCTSSGTVGPGDIDANSIGSTTTTSKTGIREDCSGATGILVYHNDLSANATTIGYFAGSYANSASGTATMTTSLIGAGACGATVTVAAPGVATTDAISWAYNAAPLVNPAELVVSAWPTAGNVNFQYCNPTAGGITPNGATINWKVNQ